MIVATPKDMPTTHPIDIEFHGLSSTEWLEADIRRRAAKLDTYCRDIMACRVTVDRPHQHHQSGNGFQVRIALTVRGGEVSISHDSSLQAPAEDLQLVIHEAFDAAKRRLQHHMLRQRGEVRRNRRRPAESPKNAVQDPR